MSGEAMSGGAGAHLYRALDASLLRASAHLADVIPSGWHDVHDDDQIEAAGVAAGVRQRGGARCCGG
jgi:hypothetical protein